MLIDRKPRVRILPNRIHGLSLVVVLVVVAALVALKMFGKQIKSMFESSTSTIAQETKSTK